MIKKLIIITLVLLVPAGFAGGWYLTTYLPEKQAAEEKQALLDKQKRLNSELEVCKEDDRAKTRLCQSAVKEFDSVLAKVAKLASPTPDRHPYRKQIVTGYRLLTRIAEAAEDDLMAIKYYDKLRTWEPQTAIWYAKLATLMLRQKDYKTATQYAHLATQLAPDVWQAHLEYARTLAQTRRYERAINAYQTTLELAPYDEKADIRQELNEFELRILSEAP